MGLRKTEQEKQAEAFERSLAGQARLAYQHGDMFFQVQIPHAEVRRRVFVASGSAERLAGSSAGELGAIEAEGWRLEHANFVYVMTGQTSADRTGFTGQSTAVNGRVDGVYLFRRRPAPHPQSG